jgi:hypothetical protein
VRDDDDEEGLLMIARDADVVAAAGVDADTARAWAKAEPDPLKGLVVSHALHTWVTEPSSRVSMSALEIHAPFQGHEALRQLCHSCQQA